MAHIDLQSYFAVDHRLQLLYNGKELPLGEGEEDEGLIAHLSDVQAGSVASGLALLCVDEAGRPSKTGVEGEHTVLGIYETRVCANKAELRLFLKAT